VLNQLLGVPLVARQLSATSSSQSQALSTSCRMVSIRARTADARIVIGKGAQTASATASHFIAANERIDFLVPPCDGPQIGYIRDTGATSNAALEITELG
jgi:hypothetical protein